MTRRVATRRAREGDTGHIITGIGFAWSCSCGERGRVRGSWNEAAAEGREHQADHEDAGRVSPFPPPPEPAPGGPRHPIKDVQP